jgi:hypothetical protein
MLLFPPFVLKTENIERNMGYSFILDPPKRGLASVNNMTLMVQWIGVLLIGSILFYLFKGKRLENEDAETVSHANDEQEDILQEALVVIDKQLKTNNPELNGYGGWLALLCISLSFITPIMTIYNLVTSYTKAEPLFSMYPGLFTLNVIDIAASSVIALFAIVCGISLGGLRDGAVKWTKRYLWTILIYAILSPFLIWLVVDYPGEARSIAIKEGLISGAKSFIYFVVWYLYLLESKRIKINFESS